MSLYTMRSVDEGWRITKFTDELNVESVYTLRPQDNTIVCDCPRSSVGDCRHLHIWQQFFETERVNQGWFYNYDTGDWLPPLEPAALPPPQVAGEVEQSGPAMAGTTKALASSESGHSQPAPFNRRGM